jgi:hypothetical protein
MPPRPRIMLRACSWSQGMGLAGRETKVRPVLAALRPARKRGKSRERARACRFSHHRFNAMISVPFQVS